ncbi:MAG: Tetratricopeptide 2 repeat protein [Planctomycetaceae bacterium]|nr:Tetratricopeptide 2 repeat protein [Planctomycetaceae bacterium]
MLRRWWLLNVVCVSCALVSGSVILAGPKAKAARARSNEEAVADAIKKLGGTVEYENQDPKQPIAAVILSNTKLTSASLKMLADLPGLKTLILSDTRLDDAGLSLLRGLEALEGLELMNTAVTDAGLPVLKSMPNLKEVYLTGSATTEKAVIALRKQMPNTEIAWLPPLPKLATAEAYFKLGEDLVLKGEREQGIRAYTAALQLDPKFVAALHSRGWALLKEDDPVSARPDFEQFVKIEPKNSLAQAGLGLALFLTGEPAKAFTVAEKAIKLDPNCSDAYYVRGMVYYDRQDFQTALPDFERAVELEPKDAANHERLGWTYYELKFYENALTAFNEAIRLDVGFEHAYYGRGLYWITMKKPAKAIEDLTKALELDPTFPDYAVDLAWAQASNGNFAAAVATQTKVLEIASDDDKPTQQQRLKAYMAKRLPEKSIAGKQAVESAAKPGAGKR